MFVTFLFCLVIGVEYGILLGVGINLMFLLYPSARPTVHVDRCTVSKKKKNYLSTERIIFFFLVSAIVIVCKLPKENVNVPLSGNLRFL